MDSIILIGLSFVGAAIIIAFLLSLVLFIEQKGNKKANLFLIFLVLINTAGCITNLLMFSGAYKTVPHFVLYSYPFVYTGGAVYFFFIKLLLNSDFKFKIIHLLHLIPFIWGLYQISWFFPIPFEEKVKVLADLWFGNHKINFSAFVIYSIPNFISICYLLVCFISISKIIQKLKVNFSDTDIEYLYWLKQFTIIYISLVLIDVTRLVFVVIFELDAGKGEIVTNLLFSLFAQYFIFQVIKNPNLVFYKFSLSQQIHAEVLKVQNEQENKKDIEKEFVVKLSSFMETQKPYLNSELKAHELAIMLGVTPQFLSKTINKEFNVNFYNFINKYRVEEFKIKIMDNENQNLKLAAVAQNVGFNSKSSFNRIFKAVTLLTPTEFIKQNKKFQSSNLISN